MKLKIKFQNIFVVLSILFLFGCCCFYGFRLVKYYKKFNPKTEAGEKTVIFSTTVRQNNPVITEGDGLYIHNGDFVFKGENVKNYVSYQNKIWRIVRINRSGSMKLVLDDSLVSMSFDKNSTKEYKNTEIYKYINDNLKLKTEGLDKTTICLDKIDDIKKITCNKTISEYFSLLSISDYVNSINTQTDKSFINKSGNMWLYNQNTQGQVWSINNNKLQLAKANIANNVKPSIILKENAHSEDGKGTKSDPYVVKDGE